LRLPTPISTASQKPTQRQELIGKAKDLHPKLLGGAFIFFALGASGGMLSLIMQGKPILSSPHSTTAFIGLGLLAFQAMLPREWMGGDGWGYPVVGSRGGGVMRAG